MNAEWPAGRFTASSTGLAGSSSRRLVSREDACNCLRPTNICSFNNCANLSPACIKWSTAQPSNGYTHKYAGINIATACIQLSRWSELQAAISHLSVLFRLHSYWVCRTSTLRIKPIRQRQWDIWQIAGTFHVHVTGEIESFVKINLTLGYMVILHMTLQQKIKQLGE